jgi:hypothetical protein
MQIDTAGVAAPPGCRRASPAGSVTVDDGCTVTSFAP